MARNRNGYRRATLRDVPDARETVRRQSGRSRDRMDQYPTYDLRGAVIEGLGGLDDDEEVERAVDTVVDRYFGLSESIGRKEALVAMGVREAELGQGYHPATLLSHEVLNELEDGRHSQRVDFSPGKGPEDAGEEEAQEGHVGPAADDEPDALDDNNDVDAEDPASDEENGEAFGAGGSSTGQLTEHTEQFVPVLHGERKHTEVFVPVAVDDDEEFRGEGGRVERREYDRLEYLADVLDEIGATYVIEKGAREQSNRRGEYIAYRVSFQVGTEEDESDLTEKIVLVPTSPKDSLSSYIFHEPAGDDWVDVASMHAYEIKAAGRKGYPVSPLQIPQFQGEKEIKMDAWKGELKKYLFYGPDPLETNVSPETQGDGTEVWWGKTHMRREATRRVRSLLLRYRDSFRMQGPKEGSIPESRIDEAIDWVEASGEHEKTSGMPVIRGHQAKKYYDSFAQSVVERVVEEWKFGQEYLYQFPFLEAPLTAWIDESVHETTIYRERISRKAKEYIESGVGPYGRGGNFQINKKSPPGVQNGNYYSRDLCVALHEYFTVFYGPEYHEPPANAIPMSTFDLRLREEGYAVGQQEQLRSVFKQVEDMQKRHGTYDGPLVKKYDKKGVKQQFIEEEDFEYFRWIFSLKKYNLRLKTLRREHGLTWKEIHVGIEELLQESFWQDYILSTHAGGGPSYHLHPYAFGALLHRLGRDPEAYATPEVIRVEDIVDMEQEREEEHAWNPDFSTYGYERKRSTEGEGVSLMDIMHEINTILEHRLPSLKSRGVHRDTVEKIIQQVADKHDEAIDTSIMRSYTRIPSDVAREVIKQCVVEIAKFVHPSECHEREAISSRHNSGHSRVDIILREVSSRDEQHPVWDFFDEYLREHDLFRDTPVETFDAGTNSESTELLAEKPISFWYPKLANLKVSGKDGLPQVVEAIPETAEAKLVLNARLFSAELQDLKIAFDAFIAQAHTPSSYMDKQKTRRDLRVRSEVRNIVAEIQGGGLSELRGSYHQHIGKKGRTSIYFNDAFESELKRRVHEDSET